MFFDIPTLSHSLPHLSLPSTPQQPHSQEMALSVTEAQPPRLSRGTASVSALRVSEAARKVKRWQTSEGSVVRGHKNKHSCAYSSQSCDRHHCHIQTRSLRQAFVFIFTYLFFDVFIAVISVSGVLQVSSVDFYDVSVHCAGRPPPKVTSSPSVPMHLAPPHLALLLVPSQINVTTAFIIIGAQGNAFSLDVRVPTTLRRRRTGHCDE